MIRYLVDSSLWVPILRGDVDVKQRLSMLADAPASFVTCGPVQAELTAGRNERNSRAIDAIVRGLPSLALPSADSFIHAGELFAQARAARTPVRGVRDCLIALIAGAHRDVILIHRDKDFDSLGALHDFGAESWR